MQQKLIQTLKTIIADVRQAYVPVILLSLIGGTGTVFYFYERALTSTIQIANIPTPLWATIALLAICYLYINLKVSQTLSSLNQPTYKFPLPYLEYQPTPGVFVYTLENSNEWYCKHCVDIERAQSTLQMVHHSAAGKNYQCHKCKFQFKVHSTGDIRGRFFGQFAAGKLPDHQG
jgi:hypothetical protein